MEHYKIFSFGGAGGNISTTIFLNKIDNNKIFYFNTDKQSIESSPIKNKFTIGFNITQGRGSGSNLNIAKQAFDEDKKLFSKLTDENCLYIIIGGFGGGTGTGMSAKMSEFLKNKRKKFIVIGTLPFLFEGKKRINQALDGIKEISQNTNNLILLKNDDLRQLFGNMTLSEAFTRADNYVVEVLKEILFELNRNEIINKIILSHSSDLEEVILKVKDFVRGDNNLIATLSSKIILADTNKELLKALTIDSDLVYAISPRKFEEIIEYIYRLSGFETKLTPSSRDDGADILVWTPPPVLGNRFLTVIQAKRYSKLNKVGSKEIRELIGTKMIFNADKAQIITTSDFSKPAKKTAQTNKIDLVKFYELNEKINLLIK